MADIQSNIDIRIDTSSALASIKLLQSQISAFNNSMARSSASASSAIRNSQQNLINNLNASGKFAATMTTVKSETESFTNALQKNKFSMGEYFRYAGAASKSFGRLFTSEFNTIQKVAESRVKSLQSQYISMGRDASGALNAIKVRPLALDMNNLSTQTQIAAQKQQILNQVLKQGSTNLLNWGKNTQWAGRQLMVGFTVPLLMFANAAEKAYKDMETASVQLRRVYGDLSTTEAETNRMAKSVQNLAMQYTKYGIAVSDTMDVAAKIAATGKQGQDLLTQVNEVSRMAALGGVSQADALETVISLTNAFGIASKDLGDNINFLNYTQNQTVLSLSDMTEAIPKAAPVVQQLGGNVKDLAFFLTAMKEGGVNATQGANALKSGLASIINPTKSATDFLGKFNINLGSIVSNNKGNIKQTVIDLGEALNKLDPLNRAQAIEKLFGKFQFSRMSALLKNVTDAKSQASMVSSIAEKSKVELEILAQRELKRVSDSPLYRFQKAQKELQAALIPLGEQFMKSMAPIIDFFTKFIKGFNDLNKSSGGFLSNLVTWVGGIAPVVLMGVGLFANGIANIVKLFAGIKSFINRTQTSSSTLGETTHYMTQEQINAAAAASSLEQAHSKLTQAFTVERANLGLLIDEYQLAIAAQNRLVGSSASAAARAVIPAAMPVAINPTVAGAAAISKVNSTLGGMRRGLPGYATGGHIQGPGTETSDSIPAMLSKGEYVIKASSVKKIGVKNLDALNSTGDIVRRAMGGSIGLPRFSQGGVAMFSGGGEAFAHIGSAITTTVDEVILAIQNAGKYAVKKGLLDMQAAGLGQSRAKVYGGLGFTAKQSVNEQMGKGGAGASDFLADFNSRGLSKWSKSLEIAGLNQQDVNADLQILDAAISDAVVAAQKLDKGFLVTDGFIEEVANKTLTELEASGSQLAAGFRKAAATATEFRTSPTKGEMSALGFTEDPSRPDSKKHMVSQTGQKIKAGRGEKQVKRLAGGYGFSTADVAPMETSPSAATARVKSQATVKSEQMFAAQADGMVQGANAAGQMASPSRRAANVVGKNLVDGALQPLEQMRGRASEAGKMLGSSFFRGAETAPKTLLSPRQRVQAAFPAVGPMIINKDNAKPYVAPVPTNTQAAIAQAKANMSREAVWLREEWGAIVNPIKTSLSAAKGQLISDAVLIEANVKKAFRAVVPESSVMGQAFTQLKAVMTVARGNLSKEWQWIKEDFLGGSNAIKTGANNIEQDMARVGRAFNVTNRIAQFQLAMGDFGAILTKGALAAVKAGAAQQVVAQQQSAWDAFIAKIRSVGSAISSAGSKTLNIGKDAVSGAKSGVLKAANAVGLRGNIEAQLAGQMALARAQKTTIMQTIEQTRLMTIEDKQLVQLLSAEQRLTEARIVELKAMLEMPTLLQKIAAGFSDMAARARIGAEQAYAAYSSMWDRFGQTRLGQSQAPYLSSLAGVKIATAELTMAQNELTHAERMADAKAIESARIRVDAAQSGLASAKTLNAGTKIQNPKWVGGASMAMMMAPMMGSMIGGSTGKTIEKFTPALMMGSLLLPAIAPMLNGFRKLAAGITPLLAKFGLFGKANAETAKSIIAANIARKKEIAESKAQLIAKRANTAAETAETGANSGAVVSEDAETAANTGAVIAEDAEIGANIGAVATEGAEDVANVAATVTEGTESVANVAAAATTFTLAGAMALLSAPVIIVTAAILLLAAGIVGLIFWINAANEQKKKEIANGKKFANAKIMTNDKLTAISEITKTVSASDIMEKKRQDSYAIAAGLSGSTEVGGQLLKSEFGKSTLADIKTMKSNGMTPAEIAKNLGTQMATAVAEGVLTSDQAKSFAAALGADLGDMSITTGMSAQLESLIGADGVDLLKNPLEVAVRLVTANQEEYTSSIDSIVNRDSSGKITGLNDEGNQENVTAAMTSGYNTLQGQQQQVDSLIVNYDKQIAEETDPTKKRALEVSKSTDVQALIDTNQANQNSIYSDMRDLQNVDEGKYDATYDSRIEDLKKANPNQKVDINTAKSAIEKIDDSDFKSNLQTAFASGALKGSTVKQITAANKNDATIGTNFNAAIAQNSATDMDTALQQVKASHGSTSAFLAQASNTKTGKGFAKQFSDVMNVRKALGFKDNAANLKIAMDPVSAKAFMTKLNGIKNSLKGIKTVNSTVVSKYITGTDPQSVYARENWNKVFGNKNVSADVAIQFSMGGEEAYNAWKAVAGNENKTMTDYGNSIIASTTTGSLTGEAATTDGADTTGGADKVDPKQLLKDTKVAAKASAFSAKIASNAWGTEFMDALSSADETTQKFYTTVKNGKVVLNAHGIELKKAFDKKAIDDAKVAVAQFSQGLVAKQKDAQAQITLMNNLIAAGVSSTTAANIAADSDNLAAYQNAIKGKKTTAEKAALLKEMITSNRTLLDLAEKAKSAEEREVNRLQNKVTLKQAEIDKVTAENKVPEMQAQMGVYGDALNVLSTSEREINKLYDERSAALDKMQKSQEAIAAAQKDQLSVADALTKGDIAAAARAAQDARANAGQRSMENQKNNLQGARTAELEGLTVSVNGKLMTRKDIEEASFDLQSKIYQIQLDIIDPLTTQLAILQEQLTIATALKTIADTNATSPSTPAAPAAKNVLTSPLATPALQARVAGNAGLARAVDKALSSDAGIAGFNWSKIGVGPIMMASGGMVPQYFTNGGSPFAIGTDTVPSMLTPGEFVMTRYAVDNFGADKLNSINSGTYSGESVYNYNLSVNMSGSNLNADDVARTVMTQIRQVNSQQLRGNSF